MLVALLLLHGFVGVVVVAAGRRLGRRAFLVAGVAPLLLWVAALSSAGELIRGDVLTSRAAWADSLGLAVDLRLDGFSLLMLMLVSGIGAAAFVYGHAYFADGPRAARAAGLLVVFAGAMAGVVLADNVLVLYACWELTSITSFALIGLDHRNPRARSAAIQALLTTGAGGLALLGGLVAIAVQAGTWQLSAILADPPSGPVVSVALVAVAVGAFTKSAQYPFHSWLPAAMVSPTPISAYLHSAAMVKAGVYLVARFAPAFADQGVWRPLVVGVGLVSMVAGGLRALRPWDLKQILAFGTVSQLGFLVVLFGIGRPESTIAGCALLVAHGLFKAALFMVVGMVDHGTGTRDIRRLPELGAPWHPALTVAVVSAASMAAVAPLAGFVAKEAAYDSLLSGSDGDRLVLVGIVVGSVLTVAYSARLVAALVRPGLVRPAAAELGPDPVSGAGGEDHPPTWDFLAPAAILAMVTASLGVFTVPWSRLVDGAGRALDGDAHAHLALWHGPTAALGLSALTLAAGAGLFVLRQRVAVIQARLAPPISGADGYQWVVSAVVKGASRVTAVVQPGSLPIYVAVVLVTAVIAPVVSLIVGGGAWWHGWPGLAMSPIQVVTVGFLIAGALAATLARRRFAAALLLGSVGYAMALLFVVQGAPDLALTQVACETLSVVLFLLVLRVLPDRFERSTPAVRVVPRLVVATMVGLLAAGGALVAGSNRTEPSVSAEMVDRAKPDGHGANVVNVILVDIRGMDTLGEVTVLATAAVGVAALVRVGRRPRPATSWTAGHPDGRPRLRRRLNPAEEAL